jgi:hypothetical protein
LSAGAGLTQNNLVMSRMGRSTTEGQKSAWGKCRKHGSPDVTNQSFTGSIARLRGRRAAASCGEWLWGGSSCAVPVRVSEVSRFWRKHDVETNRRLAARTPRRPSRRIQRARNRARECGARGTRRRDLGGEGARLGVRVNPVFPSTSSAITARPPATGFRSQARSPHGNSCLMDRGNCT